MNMGGYCNSSGPRFPDWEVWCFVLLIVLLLVISLSGCSKKIYVPVETVRTEYKYLNSKDSIKLTEKVNTKDSVIIRDSVVTTLNENGDIIRTEIWRLKEKYSKSASMYEELKLKYDSLLSTKTDSVPVQYPVEKQLSKWDQLKVDYGGFAIVAVIVFILVVVGRLVYKLKK